MSKIIPKTSPQSQSPSQHSYKYPRVKTLIMNAVKNKNLSIVITNYNIHHNVCENTIKYGKKQYLSYAIGKHSANEHEHEHEHEHMKNIAELIYKDVEKAMANYPQYYVNIFTKEEDSSIEEGHILHEPYIEDILDEV